jgi:septal ring-binding cell division protein DamX
MKDGQHQFDLGTTNHLRTMFKPSSWLSKIDFVNHLVLFNNVLITVLAEKSGGKTSFASLLLHNLDEQIKPIFMTMTPPCNREELINDIATQLHLHIDPTTNIASIVAQINDRKAQVLLIIDNAQHLPEDLIQELMIAIKSQENFGFFHLCLISDYSVVATLNNLAADQFSNLIHTIELGGLNETEARTYVLQKAMIARLINRPLTEVQYKQFYQLTKGNIAKINNGLEAFILKNSTKSSSKRIKLVKKITVSLTAMFVSGMSYFYYVKLQNNQPAAPKTVQAIPQLKSNLPSIIAAHQRLQKSIPNEQLTSHIPTYTQGAIVQLVHHELPRRLHLDELSAEDDLVNTVAVVDKVIVIPSVKSLKVAPEPKPHVTAISERKEVNPIRAAKRQSAPPQIAAVTKQVLYTIQIAASPDPADLSRFQHNNKLGTTTQIRHVSSPKGKWYVLTLGEYTTHSEAVITIKKLPRELTKLKPWIRPTSTLVNEG